ETKPTLRLYGVDAAPKKFVRLCQGGQRPFLGRCKKNSAPGANSGSRVCKIQTKSAPSVLSCNRRPRRGTFRPAANYGRDGVNLSRTQGNTRFSNPALTCLLGSALAMRVSYSAKEVPLPNRSQNALAGLRILVAEDESLIALDVERILGDFGCEVVGPV